MQRIVSFSFFFLGWVVLFPSALGQQAPPSMEEAAKGLAESVKRSLDTPFLKKAKVGLLIQNLRTGEILFSKNADEAFSPASNTKIVSTAAALYHLGPDYRFRTLLATEEGAKSKGKINGNLYLKGFGDPKLTIEDLWVFADELAVMGITEITGDLVIDDSFFDESWVVPGFNTKPSVRSPYRALVSATSLNFNAMTIRVFPGEKVGAKARVATEPIGDYVLLDDSVETTKNKTRITVDCEDKKKQMACKVRGSIAIDSPGSRLRHRIENPPMYLGRTLAAVLKERNIKLKGTVKSGLLPTEIETLYVHVSEDLGVLARDINKASNNFMAEMVLKTLGAEYKGAPGTTESGVEAIGVFLESIGLPPGTYRITNGSGLWGETRFTPSQMVKILDAAYKDFRIAPDFVASLAIAGADGTIRSRMRGSSATRTLRAKTGTLDGVICLSGYVRLGGQDILGFSFLLNDLDVSSRSIYAVQGEIGAAMANYLAAIDPKAAFPSPKLEVSPDTGEETE